jgi:integrase
MSKRSEPLYQRGGIWWCRVRNRAGRIERKSTRCRDRDAAIREWQALERASVDQDYGAATKATLAECLNDYFADLERSGVSPVTVKIAREKCGHFARLWRKGALPMAKVDARLVHEYIDQRLREGVVRYTVKRELQQLGAALKVARHLGKFHLDPMRVLPPRFRASHKPRKRAPTIEEMRALVGALGEHRAAHLLFLVSTGARRKESFLAQRGDVDWTGGLVHMRGTKTAAARGAVPITPITAPFLRWAVDHAPGRARLYNPWGNIWRDVSAACVRAGIGHLSCNDLRRAFASWHREALMAVGGSDKSAAELVSKLLRHTTDKLSQTTYADLDAPKIGGVISKLLGPVPDLYQSTEIRAKTASNGRDAEEAKPMIREENIGAGHGSRTRDLRLGKPCSISASESYEARLSTGTRLGRTRARHDRIVLNVYRGALLGVLQARAEQVAPHLS